MNDMQRIEILKKEIEKVIEKSGFEFSQHTLVESSRDLNLNVSITRTKYRKTDKMDFYCKEDGFQPPSEALCEEIADYSNRHQIDVKYIKKEVLKEMVERHGCPWGQEDEKYTSPVHELTLGYKD